MSDKRYRFSECKEKRNNGDLKFYIKALSCVINEDKVVEL